VKTFEQRIAILANVVIARAMPETIGVFVVVGQGNG
jgi:hypothetical protein